jgi:3-hydroxybutyrate dehydrogenase
VRVVTRIAMVTGGGRGIGRACARALRRDGHTVAVVDIDRCNGREVAQEVDGVYFQANLIKPEDARRVVAEVVETLGSLDILVNNAGFQHIAPIPEFPEDTWDEMISLMLTAPFLLTRYSWPQLMASGKGRIINIGSVHSLTASPLKVGYVTAKHGLVGLTKATALEGAKTGITCNTICPAFVRTALTENQIADQAKQRGISPAEAENIVLFGRTAIKKLLEPEDVGTYVAFLASEAAWGITGSVQTMDLGWTAG